MTSHAAATQAPALMPLRADGGVTHNCALVLSNDPGQLHYVCVQLALRCNDAERMELTGRRVVQGRTVRARDQFAVWTEWRCLCWSAVLLKWLSFAPSALHAQLLHINTNAAIITGLALFVRMCTAAQLSCPHTTGRKA